MATRISKKTHPSNSESSPGKKEENPNPASQGLKAKWKNFWRETLKAGARLDGLSPWEKARQQLWLFNVGQVKGLLKGLQAGLGQLADPRSSFHKTTAAQIHQDSSHLGERLLDYGTAYMQADWERRGEMTGESTVKTGLWILSLRSAGEDFKKLLRGTLK